MHEFARRYGPWAVVTGASSGLGGEFCRQLADRGLGVVLVARRADELRLRAAEVEARGARSRVVAIDLQAPGAGAALAAAVEELDVGLLVQSAGALSVGAFDGSDLDRELALLDLNVRVPMELTRRFLPGLLRRGRGGVVLLSSFVAYRGGPHLANYTASKAWGLSFAESLGPELAPRGVDVLAVCPGFVDTPMLAPFQPGVGRVPGMPLSPAAPVVAAALGALGRRTSVIPGRWHLWLHRAMRWLPRDVAARLVGARTARVFLPSPRISDAADPPAATATEPLPR